jgi:hypothetical protein
MNKENSSKMKQNLSDGLSAAAGATVGSILGNAFMGAQVMAAENPQGEDAEVLNATPAEHAHATTQQVPAEPEQPIVEATNDIQGEVATPEPDVHVLAYERVTLENGQQMDLAAVQEGEEVSVYVDHDVDGTADIKWTDTNHNGEVEQNELANVQDQHIDMENFQEAADYMPEYAENTMPDYVNDADAGTYMA